MRKPRITKKRVAGLRTIASYTQVNLEAGEFVEQGLKKEIVEEVRSALEYLYKLCDYYDEYLIGAKCPNCGSRNVNVKELSGYDHKNQTQVGVNSCLCLSCKWGWSD